MDTHSVGTVARESFATYSFREEIGGVVGALDRDEADNAIRDVVRHEIPSPVNMAGTCRRSSILSEETCTAAVDEDGDGSVELDLELFEDIYEAEEITHSGAKPIQLGLGR